METSSGERVPLATDPFVLPKDVSITPVEQLVARVRDSIGASPGDFVVARPRSRARATVANACTAELLESFREPRPIVDAILAFSRRYDADPEATLLAAFAPLSEFVRDGILVPEHSLRAQSITSSLSGGTDVEGFEIIDCLHVHEDTELYRVRDAGGRYGALKIVGHARVPAASEMIEHEASLLERLDGHPTPSLLHAGTVDDRPFVITAWCPGVTPDVIARELDTSRHGADSSGLLTLATSILDAYAALHSRMVVHGDVHLRNILVDASGRVTLIDLGLARIAGDVSHAGIPRGGVGEFLEPELARAILEGDPPPPSTFQSDQYGVAALLFRLFANTSYLDCPLRESELHRAIVDRPPSSFARVGVPAWPDVEILLSRALNKSPTDRFASMAEFAAAVRRARAPRVAPAARTVIGGLDRLRERVLLRFGADGPLLRGGLGTPRLASVTFGTAGIAWAAYRLACIESRADWLATAELWLDYTRSVMDRADAFHDASSGLEPEVLGEVSLYHSRSGVHCVEAAVARALGSARATEHAVNAFLAAAASPSAKPDLAFGRAGVLLGCALLQEARWSDTEACVDATRRLGDQTMDAMTAWMKSLPPVGRPSSFPNLGVAHGWAGALYSALRWCDVSGCNIPGQLPDRLSQLADCGLPGGRGLQWPWIDGTGGPGSAAMPGWCNGSAGLVHLWIAAHRALRDERFVRLAELAAWDAWEHPSRAPSLCCGLAGRAYALLALFRYVGEPVWLDRAWRLAERAAKQPIAAPDAPFADSLFKGDLGIALLAADLGRPRESFMPFFEAEGWTRRERPS